MTIRAERLGDGLPAADVVQLHAIRTLTIGHDLGFRHRAMTVLSELGPAAFAVVPFDRAEDLVALVLAQRADVVLLDVTVSSAPVAELAAMLAARAPRVGVIVVADRPANGLAVLPKWGWASELADAVRQAHRVVPPTLEEADPDAGHH